MHDVIIMTFRVEINKNTEHRKTMRNYEFILFGLISELRHQPGKILATVHDKDPVEYPRLQIGQAHHLPLRLTDHPPAENSVLVEPWARRAIQRVSER